MKFRLLFNFPVSLNKILKDITLRSKFLSGFQVHFTPGWDCHGLPIEIKVLKENNKKSSAVEIRKDAFRFAEKAKERQLTQFKKWGLLTDWENSYTTSHPDYIANQWKLFYALYEKKLIYQDYKPVFWSPSNRTSLAEAELEYNPEHVSKSVYVKFPILKCPDSFKRKLDSSAVLYGLIWTTTPWTLPANQAICFSMSKRYCLVQAQENNEVFIVAKEVLPSLENSLKINFRLIDEFEGSELKGCTYLHPLLEGIELTFISSHHVTTKKGTGLVHMAPNHGLEDYAAAKLNGIPLSPCIVDDDGKFQAEAGDVLAGKEVLGAGSEAVLELMKSYIVHQHDYVHSYPYDWRSNKPVVIRSSHQWFVDVETLKEQAKLCLNEVQLIPDVFAKVFINQLQSSPPWCISRQRVWGVPIPVFYQDGNKVPIINVQIIEHLCKLLKEKGIHFWWELPEEKLLPPDMKQEGNCTSKKYTKSSDIIDIWFDSGVSWKCVLPEPRVSDVCIEGIDQIRGWFNSSLLTSIAFRGIAPYRKLFFHGFIVDADGHKMSKSKGNVLNPEDITDGNKNSQPMGVDVLRWWVGSYACQHDNIAFKPCMIDDCNESIAKIRNVFKFLLGNIQKFNFATDRIDTCQMRPVDQYVMQLSQEFLIKVQKFYDELLFKNACFEILSFITYDISSYFFQSIKDRLYCDMEESVSRRSCLTVMYLLCDVLVRCIAPIVPHLAEEVYLYHPDAKKRSVGAFKTDWSFLSSSLSSPSVHQPILFANEIRKAIFKFETKTVSMELIVDGHDLLLQNLHSLQPKEESLDSDLCELFQVSKVKFGCVDDNTTRDCFFATDFITSSVAGADDVSYRIKLQPTALKACPRCRRFILPNETTLCKRCEEVMQLKIAS